MSILRRHQHNWTSPVVFGNEVGEKAGVAWVCWNRKRFCSNKFVFLNNTVEFDGKAGQER